MSYVCAIFTAFIAGMLWLVPAASYAHPPVRPAWLTQAASAKMPVAWTRQSPVRAWKYVTRPAVVQVQFPAAAVPNQAVWDIPLQTTLERSALARWKRVPWAHLLRKHTFPGKAEIDAVIFDLDGTLLDSLSAWEHSGSNFVRSLGFEPPEDLDERLVSMSLLDGANLIKEMYHLPYTPEEILERTLRPIKTHYETDIPPMPGIPQTLARLHAQGVKLAVATASERELAQKALSRLGLLDYFEFIITCDEVGVGKSKPAVYEEALKRLGTSKARTLVVEDALHALETAAAAGFPTAAIEEPHSASQRLGKQHAATYYVFSYEGENVFPALP